MKFKLMNWDEVNKNRTLIKAEEFGNCLICDEPTLYLDYCGECGICSEECYDDFTKMLNENEIKMTN
jgi:ferredoxin